MMLMAHRRTKKALKLNFKQIDFIEKKIILAVQSSENGLRLGDGLKYELENTVKRHELRTLGIEDYNDRIKAFATTFARMMEVGKIKVGADGALEYVDAKSAEKGRVSASSPPQQYVQQPARTAVATGVSPAL